MSDARAREQRVMRCDCGQFVRLDRNLTESDSGPDLADSDFEEATRAVSSLEEIEGAAQAFGLPGPGPSRAKREPSQPPASDESAEDEPTRLVSSPLKLSAFLPQAPKSEPSASSAGPSKLVWYVDLGGVGTIEMTIDKLIMARRSGKIGESALVWRPGMARWRPVGTLIAAAGAGTSRPAAEARSRPSNPKLSLPPPSKPNNPVPSQREQSGPLLAVYDRPARTLEFAIEAEQAPPARASQTAAPAQPTNAGESHPARPPSSTSTARAVEVTALRQAPRVLAPAKAGAFLTALPKWAAVAVPAVVCTTLAIAGALVVRSFRAPRPSPALSSAPATAAIAAARTEPTIARAAQPAPEETNPEPIVDVDSLSLEKRPAVRPRLAAISGQARSATPAAQLEIQEPAPAADTGDEDEEGATAQPKRDAGTRQDAGSRKNRAPDLGEQDEKNPFYNPGF